MPSGDDADSFASLFEAGPSVPRVRTYRVGEVLDLEVVRVTGDAVFLEMDGKHEGIVDAADLAAPDGSCSVAVGARLAVRVTEVSSSTGEIHLTPVSPDPLVSDSLEATARGVTAGGAIVTGMRVKGTVASVERYGVFLDLPSGGERTQRGLVPTKDLGAPRGADLRKAFPVGKELEAVVTSVDDKKRIRLSVVALQAAEERKEFETFAKKSREKSDGSGKPGRGGSLGTFADLIKQRSR